MLEYGYYNMNCMDGMRQFPDKFFDLAIVDPEYGRKEHGGKDRGRYVRQKNGKATYVPGGDYQNRGWDNRPADKIYFDELLRISRHQIIWGANYYDYFFSGGGIIVWDKCNDGSCQSDAEIAYNSLTNRVDICRYMWRGMMQGKSITEGWIQQGNKKLNEKRIHPTQKPVNLYRWIIQKYDIPKEWKLIDTHVGSASSLIAYHGAGMQHVIGFEIDEYMYHKSLDRYKQETAQLSLHDIGMI